MLRFLYKLERRAFIYTTILITLVITAWSTTYFLFGSDISINIKKSAKLDKTLVVENGKAVNAKQTETKKISQNRSFKAALVCLQRQHVRLKGVIQSEKQNLALITQNSAPQDFFKTGDKLSCGFTIEAIKRDSILISFNAITSQLYITANNFDNTIAQTITATAETPELSTLQQDLLDNNNFNASELLQKEYIDLPRSLYPFPEQGLPSWITVSASGQYVVKQATFKKLLNSSRMSKQARFTTDSEGIHISEVMPGSLYEKLGVRNSDLIQKLNGRQVENLHTVMATFQQAEIKQTIELQVLRNGNVEYLYYSLEN